jgi:murein DD-endopeptidase MepM/ murein hydrolase activator NlpD
VRLLKPWPDPYTVNPNGKYGNRRHPITGRTKKHRGLDVAYSGLIHAPADGEVVHKGAALNKRTGGGYTLIVKHAPDLYTVYYHLREPSKLAVGAKVSTGDVLAHTGTTGASTGVHLHWETRKSRSFGTDFDPRRLWICRALLRTVQHLAKVQHLSSSRTGYLGVTRGSRSRQCYKPRATTKVA